MEPQVQEAGQPPIQIPVEAAPEVVVAPEVVAEPVVVEPAQPEVGVLGEGQPEVVVEPVLEAPVEVADVPKE